MRNSEKCLEMPNCLYYTVNQCLENQLKRRGEYENLESSIEHELSPANTSRTLQTLSLSPTQAGQWDGR